MKKNVKNELDYEGKKKYFLDVDRMVNEGLGGGQVTQDNGLIEDSTTDTLFETNSSVGSSVPTDAADFAAFQDKEVYDEKEKLRDEY